MVDLRGDDLILKLFAKIGRIENFVKSQRQGGVVQSAADNGPAAFSAACAQYGAPVVLNDDASAGGVDISACGFATGDSEDSDDEGMDVETELQQLRSEVAAATGVRMVQASFAPPVSAVVAATTANVAPSFSYSAVGARLTSLRVGLRRSLRRQGLAPLRWVLAPWGLCRVMWLSRR
ncbi:hypothetical protein CYMTET_17002 [Cymbomonas tetramitiformis]|uniref:Uncharacterized protein n=1 Tax=Cymbomonas tetramitiformis TaxID=36881 RepID=A0AAE0L7R6_9CHLO|nr:hypothetical protein CYMTET_17002 [Cymbomonas tetramitiformis]